MWLAAVPEGFHSLRASVFVSAPVPSLLLLLAAVVTPAAGFPSWLGWDRSDDNRVICNPGSVFSCACNLCWSADSPFPPTETHWVAVEMQKCPSLTLSTERMVREKLAQWLVEECAFVLNCHFDFTPAAENVLIGGTECTAMAAGNKGVLYLAMLTNASAEVFQQDNLVPAAMIGSVVQAREHLLSSVLGGDLDAVSIIEKTATTRVSDTRRTSSSSVSLLVYAGASFFAAFFCTLSLVLTCGLLFVSRVRWSRFSSSKWLEGTSTKTRLPKVVADEAAKLATS